MYQMFPSGEAPQSPLMREAMKVHGVDGADVPDGLLRLANARCLKCQDADACFAWLTGKSDAGAYRWFCPNAKLFDGLPKTQKH
ncbi:MAG: hypothetical protein COW30_08335 [Rhodospirillales bacterium CG15_BIG_FIL_POST_REV_8_21_14_020_66_15]|nr:MAG: hypothetical protein COW30_08335 [Rhodospirillales bacterium CG15_BIG_FIL_POST_REV_8_21_14_020_66_15]